MSVNDQLDKLQRSLLDFFFPRRCPFCGRASGKDLLCGACETSLPYSREVRTGTFGRCAAPLYYEGAVPGGPSSPSSSRAAPEALDCFGSLMARTAAQEFSGEFDAVTWVPVSAKRLRKRGFDQARYLLRQPLRGLAHHAAGDAAQGAGQPAPVRSGGRGGPPRQCAGRLRAGVSGGHRQESASCWWTIS